MVEEYCQTIVQPQWPLDEIAIALFAHMYNIHICVFVEGKFWTTNRNQAINGVNIYLVYYGKLKFLDTVRKGSLNKALLNKSPAAQYYLRSNSPEKGKNPHNTKSEQVSGRKTLNSLRVGLTKPSDLSKAFKEFQKFNTEVPKDIPKQVKPKPSGKPKKPKGSLDVTHHGIKKRKPRNHKFFCLICKKILTYRGK